MADTQEFLDDKFREYMFVGKTVAQISKIPKKELEKAEELKQAILQHFQQEQEKKVGVSFYKDELELAPLSDDFVEVAESRTDDVNHTPKLYSQSEVDRLIREELELLMDRYTKIARKNTSIAISPLIIANRLVELSKQKEGSKDV